MTASVIFGRCPKIRSAVPNSSRRDEILTIIMSFVSPTTTTTTTFPCNSPRHLAWDSDDDDDDDDDRKPPAKEQRSTDEASWASCLTALSSRRRILDDTHDDDGQNDKQDNGSSIQESENTPPNALRKLSSLPSPPPQDNPSDPRRRKRQRQQRETPSDHQDDTKESSSTYPCPKNYDVWILPLCGDQVVRDITRRHCKTMIKVLKKHKLYDNGKSEMVHQLKETRKSESPSLCQVRARKASSGEKSGKAPRYHESDARCQEDNGNQGPFPRHQVENEKGRICFQFQYSQRF